MSKRSRCTLGIWWIGVAACLTATQCAQAQAQVAEAADPNSASALGMDMDDERIYQHVLLDEFEARFGSADIPFRWDGQGWVGGDSNRLWVKSEGFAINGALEDGDQELLYDRPISSYFDVQAGARYDLDSRAGRGWAAVGVEGLAPYLFALSATLYASDAGHFAAKLLTSYDELLTQRLILQPLAELNAYTRADAAREVGAGLSDLDTGVRLRYEISRKLAPYVGVIYRRSYGPASGTTVLDDARGGAWRVAAGLRAWL